MQFIIEIWLVCVIMLVIGLFWCAIVSNRHRKEEEEWLKNNPNRTSYVDFDCTNKTVKEHKK